MAGVILSLAAAVVPTGLYAWLVWWCDRYEREPGAMLLASFLWGAAPAVLLSLIAEFVLEWPLSELFSPASQQVISSSILAPVIEETFKAVALLGLWLLASHEFDGVLDGIVYGALVGFGFGMTENFLYFVNSLAASGWGAWFAVVFIRALLFGFNHAFFTSLTGIGLGIARSHRHRGAQIAAPLMGLAAAIMFHSLHNLGITLTTQTCGGLVLSLLADWGGIWVVIAIITLAWRQERSWVQQYLADEGVPAEHIEAVRASRLWDHIPVVSAMLWSGPQRRWQRYHQLLVELAFRKHQQTRLGDEQSLQAEIQRLREEIQQYRETHLGDTRIAA